MKKSESASIEKLPTLISGFDHIAVGGLPLGRTTLVTGTAGSSKTVFAAQFLAAGIQHANEPGVFVTFEESADDVRRNMKNFGWDIAGWEAAGKWAFVDADNVIILRNVLEEEKRRRTIEILKFRGTMHRKGEYPFTIIPGEGIVAIPLSAIELKQQSSDTRITSGSKDLDAMCGGGFFRDSIILISGATGTGKTLMATEFMAGGGHADERCLLFAFEESRQQLFRNSIGWGVDFDRLEKEGKLRVVCEYPETANLEDHLIQIKRVILDFKPTRVAVDSLSALERISTAKGFREFVIGLTSFIKHQEIAGLFTATTPNLLGGTSVTDAHISTITDSIILLRYVEIYGEMRRGLTVLKMRGSRHDKDIREFAIDGTGMHIGKPFREVTGILAGTPRHASGGELEHIRTLFTQE